jgi:nucleoid-associated protein YgaU
MTRETKIGLLVGLAFIIVIGILLSDHFRSTMEPPQAALTNAAAEVRQAVNSPGSANPPITMVVPQETPPTEAVPTHDELTQPPSPVIPSAASKNDAPTYTSGAAPKRNGVTQPPAANDQNETVAGADGPGPNGDNLVQAARQHGETLVQSNIDGSPKSAQSSSPADSGGPKPYKAQSGDNVSRMASRFMGGNTRANRQAIIDANPSLQQDPDRVIVGQSYMIPSRADSAAPAVTESQPPVSTPAPAAGNIYTVEEGDSLWRIANDQLGDPSAINAIKELNMDVLQGDDHDVITPGMKLHLPGKPVASAN